MGFWMGTSKEGQFIDGVRVGSNGSQWILAALWFAAYAVANRPESNRVCAWVNNHWPRGGAVLPGAPYARRNQPKTVAALIAFNIDGCTAVTPQNPTIEWGLKFKPVTDPMLQDLVEFWRHCNDKIEPYGRIPADLVARLADHFSALLPHLQTSCWYDDCAEVAYLFRVAKSHGLDVTYG